MLVLHNETSQGFITSDRPVAIYNILYEDVRHNSYRYARTTGVIYYVPLFTTRGIFLYDKQTYKVKASNGGIFALRNKRDVFKLNRLTTIHAHQCIYFDPDLAEMAVVLGRNATVLRRQRELVVNENVDQEAGESLVRSFERFPNLKISLTFVSIPKRIQEDRMRLGTLRGEPRVTKSRKDSLIYNPEIQRRLPVDTEEDPIDRFLGQV